MMLTKNSFFAFALSALANACSPAAGNPTQQNPQDSGVDVYMSPPISDAAPLDSEIVEGGTPIHQTLVDPSVQNVPSPTLCREVFQTESSLSRILGHPSCRKLANNTLWLSTHGDLINYPRFTDEQKAILDSYYSAIRNGDRTLTHRGMPLPCHNADAANQDPIKDFFTAPQAYTLYAARVAQTFGLETAVQRGEVGHLPWSILDYTPEQLQILLSASYMFSYQNYLIRHSGHEGQYPYSTIPTTSAQTTLCDPRDGFNFMSGRNGPLLIGGTQRETVGNVAQWLADSALHDLTMYRDRRTDLPGLLRTVQSLVTTIVREPNESGEILVRRIERNEEHIPMRLACKSAAVTLEALLQGVNIPAFAAFSTYLHPDIIAMNEPMLHPDNPRLYSIIQMAHGGLAVNLGGELYILPHTDFIYANNLSNPRYLLSASGDAIASPSESSDLFFRTFFKTPAQLMAAGFVPQVPVPVIPNSGMPTRLPSGTTIQSYDTNPEDYTRLPYANFGRYLGYWDPAPGERRYTGGSANIFIEEWRARFELGAWTGYIQYQCDDPIGTILTNNLFNSVFAATSLTTIPGLTLEGMRERARSIQEVYGCEAIRNGELNSYLPGHVAGWRD